jgi:asparagine synthase (glutamine-hydrolysing)
MCGIFGILSQTNLSDEDVKRVSDIGKILNHRGPDGQGFWHKNNIALGHRRLSILDLSNAGTQPMHYKNNRYVIVYNGELYNFIELRRELQKVGYSFKSNTDTEVIVAAFDFWGKDCLKKFNGMWAFSLWDSDKKTLFLSRDRYGVKPLYYINTSNNFVFSSEVKGIHKWQGKSASFNTKIMSEISQGSRRHHGTSETHLVNVFSLPAGHNLIIKNGNITIECWYKLSKVDVPTSLNDQSEEFLHIFEDACNIRLRSDVSIASCLSGGLDSSSIVSVIHNNLSKKDPQRRPLDYHKAFTASFPKTLINEVNVAKGLSDELGFDLNILEMESPSIERLESALKANDGPMPNLAFYPIYELYSYIRKNNIKVTLDGMGPDEMLGGYQPLSDALKAAFQSKDLFWAADVFNVYRSQGENQFVSSKKLANNILLHTVVDPFISFIRGGSFSPTISNNYSVKTPNGLDSFQGHLFKSFFQNTLPMLLHQYDRCSMASGVESRMPFLDYRLVEYAFSLPNKSRVGDGYTKRILRESMKGIVPDRILQDKQKIGFHPPQIDWFKGSMYKWMKDIVNDRSFIESSFFDGKKLQKKFNDYDPKKIDDKKKWNHIGDFYGPVCVTWWCQNSNYN